MDTESIEYLLLSYFNEVVWVDENPAMLTTSETFKENGKIKTSHKEEFIHLNELLIESLDDINNFLYNEFMDCNSIDINFYPKNVITKLLNIKGNKELKRELESLTSNNYIITSNSLYDSYLSSISNTIYLSNRFDDKIIVGEKSMIILNRNLKEFYIDKSKIKVINLK